MPEHLRETFKPKLCSNIKMGRPRDLLSPFSTHSWIPSLHSRAPPIIGVKRMDATGKNYKCCGLSFATEVELQEHRRRHVQKELWPKKEHVSLTIDGTKAMELHKAEKRRSK